MATPEDSTVLLQLIEQIDTELLTHQQQQQQDFGSSTSSLQSVSDYSTSGQNSQSVSGTSSLISGSGSGGLGNSHPINLRNPNNSIAQRSSIFLNHANKNNNTQPPSGSSVSLTRTISTSSTSSSSSVSPLSSSPPQPRSPRMTSSAAAASTGSLSTSSLSSPTTGGTGSHMFGPRVPQYTPSPLSSPIRPRYIQSTFGGVQQMAKSIESLAATAGGSSSDLSRKLSTNRVPVRALSGGSSWISARTTATTTPAPTTTTVAKPKEEEKEEEHDTNTNSTSLTNDTAIVTHNKADDQLVALRLPLSPSQTRMVSTQGQRSAIYFDEEDEDEAEEEEEVQEEEEAKEKEVEGRDEEVEDSQVAAVVQQEDDENDQVVPEQQPPADEEQQPQQQQQQQQPERNEAEDDYKVEIKDTDDTSTTPVGPAWQPLELDLGFSNTDLTALWNSGTPKDTQPPAQIPVVVGFAASAPEQGDSISTTTNGEMLEPSQAPMDGNNSNSLLNGSNGRNDRRRLSLITSGIGLERSLSAESRSQMGINTDRGDGDNNDGSQLDLPSYDLAPISPGVPVIENGTSHSYAVEQHLRSGPLAGQANVLSSSPTAFNDGTGTHLGVGHNNSSAPGVSPVAMTPMTPMTPFTSREARILAGREALLRMSPERPRSVSSQQNSNNSSGLRRLSESTTNSSVKSLGSTLNPDHQQSTTALSEKESTTIKDLSADTTTAASLANIVFPDASLRPVPLRAFKVRKMVLSQRIETYDQAFQEFKSAQVGLNPWVLRWSLKGPPQLLKEPPVFIQDVIASNASKIEAMLDYQRRASMGGNGLSGTIVGTVVGARNKIRNAGKRLSMDVSTMSPTDQLALQQQQERQEKQERRSSGLFYKQKSAKSAVELGSWSSAHRTRTYSANDDSLLGTNTSNSPISSTSVNGGGGTGTLGKVMNQKSTTPYSSAYGTTTSLQHGYHQHQIQLQQTASPSSMRSRPLSAITTSSLNNVSSPLSGSTRIRTMSDVQQSSSTTTPSSGTLRFATQDSIIGGNNNNGSNSSSSGSLSASATSIEGRDDVHPLSPAVRRSMSGRRRPVSMAATVGGATPMSVAAAVGSGGGGGSGYGTLSSIPTTASAAIFGTISHNHPQALNQYQLAAGGAASRMVSAPSSSSVVSLDQQSYGRGAEYDELRHGQQYGTTGYQQQQQHHQQQSPHPFSNPVSGEIPQADHDTSKEPYSPLTSPITIPLGGFPGYTGHRMSMSPRSMLGNNSFAVGTGGGPTASRPMTYAGQSQYNLSNSLGNSSNMGQNTQVYSSSPTLPQPNYPTYNNNSNNGGTTPTPSRGMVSGANLQHTQSVSSSTGSTMLRSSNSTSSSIYSSSTNNNNTMTSNQSTLTKKQLKEQAKAEKEAAKREEKLLKQQRKSSYQQQQVVQQPQQPIEITGGIKGMNEIMVERSLDNLCDVLPHVDRDRLMIYLQRAGGDEMVAIGLAMADLKK